MSPRSRADGAALPAPTMAIGEEERTGGAAPLTRLQRFSGPRGKTRPAVGRSASALLMRLAGMAVGVVTAAVISRTLGVAGYGVFALGMTVLGVLGQLADSGMVQALSAQVARTPERTAELATSAVVVRLAVAIVTTLAVACGGWAWLPGGQAAVVVVLAACAPVGALGALTGVTNAQVKPQVAALLALTQGVLWLGMSLVIATTDARPVMFAWGYLGLAVLQAAITAVIFSGRGVLGRPTWRAAALMARTAAPAALLGLLVTAYYRADSVLLFGLSGAHETGLYAAGYRFLDVAQILPGLLVVPLLPMLSRRAVDPDERARSTLCLVRIALFVGAAGAILLSAGAPLLISVVYGPEYRAAVWPLRLLGVAYLGIVLGYVGTTAVFALGQTWKQIPRVVVIAALSMALQVPAIMRFGASGAAVATALTECGIALNGLHLMRRSMGLPSGQVRLAPAAAVTLAGVACSALVPSPLAALAVGIGFVVLLCGVGVVRPADLRLALRRPA